MAAYFLCIVLFSLGIYCVLVKRNIIKIVLGIAIAEYAVNLFFILASYRVGGAVPIFEPGSRLDAPPMVDPLPQALVLTAIVIGLATTALTAAIAMRIYDKYGTYDIDEIKELKG
ncbi:MAG: sodium:proton antiporter [Candidatus Hydrogenedentota bacterium]